MTQFVGDPRQWAVVMPSIRTINLDYLAAIPPQVKIIVVDDSNGSIEPNRENMEVYRYADYAAVLGDQQDVIPRKTDTCRSFGFYMAWQQGFRYVVTLDDDCCTHPGFLAEHAIVGQTRTVKSVACDPWYNTIDNLELLHNEPQPQNGQSEPRRWYARGVPYCYRTQPAAESTFSTSTGRVVCNMGMWLKVPDINGLDKLEHPMPDSIGVHDDLLAVARGTAFSLCIMNVAILGEALPAFYQLPMNIPVADARLDRFGDIWSGYILKRLADVRGDLVTIGQPAVTHTKAGNTLRETRVETYGHLLENYFYRFVDEAVAELSADDYAAMYGRFARGFARAADREKLPPVYDEFFATMSDKMIRWAKLTGVQAQQPVFADTPHTIRRAA